MRSGAIIRSRTHHRSVRRWVATTRGGRERRARNDDKHASDDDDCGDDGDAGDDLGGETKKRRARWTQNDDESAREKG